MPAQLWQQCQQDKDKEDTIATTTKTCQRCQHDKGVIAKLDNVRQPPLRCCHCHHCWVVFVIFSDAKKEGVLEFLGGLAGKLALTGLILRSALY
jgi:hypothetical protein